jgi:hypothetical protein
MSKAYNTPSNHTNNDTPLGALHAPPVQHDNRPSMDSRQAEYPQSGLQSPYAPYHGHESEGSPTDQSAVQYQHGQDYKSSNFSSSATPESSYGLPQSARSGSFPDYVQQPRSYPESQQPNRYPAGTPSNMAQTSSPSLDASYRTNGHGPNQNSDASVPVDPSIAQSSPSYPSSHGYSPYPPQHEMHQYPGQPMTPYGRPEWAGGYQQSPMYGHSPATSAGGTPGMASHAIARPPTVSSGR